MRCRACSKACAVPIPETPARSSRSASASRANSATRSKAKKYRSASASSAGRASVPGRAYSPATAEVTRRRARSVSAAITASSRSPIPARRACSPAISSTRRSSAWPASVIRATIRPAGGTAIGGRTAAGAICRNRAAPVSIPFTARPKAPEIRSRSSLLSACTKALASEPTTSLVAPMRLASSTAGRLSSISAAWLRAICRLTAIAARPTIRANAPMAETIWSTACQICCVAWLDLTGPFGPRQSALSAWPGPGPRWRPRSCACWCRISRTSTG